MIDKTSKQKTKNKKQKTKNKKTKKQKEKEKGSCISFWEKSKICQCGWFNLQITICGIKNNFNVLVAQAPFFLFSFFFFFSFFKKSNILSF
jgi:hypothetical protein